MECGSFRRSGGEIVLQDEIAAAGNRGPFSEELGADRANLLDFTGGELAWCKFVELFEAPERPTGALGIEHADDALDLEGLDRKRAARALARDVIKVPPGGHEPEESLRIPERGFDGQVRKIVEREVSAVLRLFLPDDRAVITRAAENSGAVGALGDFDTHEFLRGGKALLVVSPLEGSLMF